MKPIDIFEKRLDEILKDKYPAKALILDAFNKAEKTWQSIIFTGGYEKGIKEGKRLLLAEMTELYIKKHNQC